MYLLNSIKSILAYKHYKKKTKKPVVIVDQSDSSSDSDDNSKVRTISEDNKIDKQ